MRDAITLVAACVLTFPAVPSELGAQLGQAPPAVTVSIYSRLLREERPVVVYLPESYRLTSGRYPVLVVLDGDDAVGPTVGAIAREMADVVRGSAPELLVVAVPNRNRDRDLTPAVPSIRGAAPSAAPAPEGRGAAVFLQFVETELLPAIERQFRTVPTRFLVGHSSGGLFATFAFITRPALFRGVIAASPALYEDDFVWVDQLRLSLAQRPAEQQWLIVTKGEQDHPLIHEAFSRVQAELQRGAPEQLAWRTAVYAGEHHSSARYPAVREGLRFMFSSMWVDWKTLGQLSVEDVESRFAGLSLEFGWPVTAPPWAYWRLLLAQDIAQAPYARIRHTGLAMAARFPWHPGAYEGCYRFLQAKEDATVALNCAEDALGAARRAGYWTGEIEVTVAKLRQSAR